MTGHPDPDVEQSVAFVRDERVAGDGKKPSAILRALLETQFGARAWFRAGDLARIYIVFFGFDVPLADAMTIAGLWNPTDPSALFSDEGLDELLSRRR